MKKIIKAIYIDMWDIIEFGYEFLEIMVDRVYEPKVKSLWMEEKGRD